MSRRSLLARLRETARLMIGLPSYEAYRRHMHERHAQEAVMTEEQFFRERQQARYGGRGAGRCC